MRRLKSPWTRAFIVWTVALFVACTVLAIAAFAGFLSAADACWFQTGPCSQVGDADWVRLQVAIFGVPLIWLVGVVVGGIARALSRRRRTATY